MNFNKKIAITLLLVVALMLALGFSYAKFIAPTVIGNNNYNVITGNTISGTEIIPNFVITYDEGDPIVDTGNIMESTSEMIKFKIATNYELSQMLMISLSTIINSLMGNGSYALYSCSAANYAAATTSNLSTNCTNLSPTSNIVLPTNGNKKNLLKDTYVTINESSTNYFVFMLSTTTTTTYKQYRGVIEVSNYVINQNSLVNTILATTPPVADNIASTYVGATSGINFNTISSPTNGQGLYVNNKVNVTPDPTTGLIRYFRGGNYCAYPNYTSTSTSYCGTAGGTWTNYHCSLDDSKEACQNRGYTYYELKNNVMFAGYAWRIIRINEDDTVRLLYNGTTTTTRGTGIQNSTSKINASSAGYTYGDTNTDRRDGNMGTNSIIKTAVDTWYNNNLASYADYISQNSSFCNDTTIGSTLSNGATYSGAYIRLYSNKTPTFNCPATPQTYGGEYFINVGMMTLDELSYAGAVVDTYNYRYYPAGGERYWTLSPNFITGNLNYWVMELNGDPSTGDSVIGNIRGFRIVINLQANVTVSEGSGTLDDPWIIDTN